MAAEFLLASQRAVPERLLAAGFDFADADTARSTGDSPRTISRGAQAPVSGGVVPNPLAPVRRDRERAGSRGDARAGRVPALVELFGRVVPEPVLSRLEATDDAVLRALCMRRGMLARRGVAASDVAARCAAPQMEPPPPGFEAFDASGSTRGDSWIDSLICHWLLLGSRVDRRCAGMVVEWRMWRGIAQGQDVCQRGAYQLGSAREAALEVEARCLGSVSRRHRVAPGGTPLCD